MTVTVQEYFQALPEPQRTTLRAVWMRLRELLPDAQEAISYGVPTLKVGGTGVAGVSAATKHCSYLPMSGTVLASVSEDLTGYAWSKGALRFAVDKPLPGELLALLVRTRLAEIGA